MTQPTKRRFAVELWALNALFIVGILVLVAMILERVMR